MPGPAFVKLFCGIKSALRLFKKRVVKILFVLLVVAVVVAGVAYGRGTDNIDRRTIPAFDVRRYMGDWYEIARYDHAFERGLVEVRASYRLVSDGRVEVLNSGTDLKSGKRRTARGKARLTTRPGRLRVSFFWIFYSDYNILELGRDYEWALVGSSSDKYLWILSRTPTLPAVTLNRILRLAEQRGYRRDRLLYVDQQSEETTS